MAWLHEFKEDALDWCRAKSWIWRLPILSYLTYAGVRHLINPYYSSIFGGITFGIHELGHVIFSFAGEFLMTAGGTIAQLLAPLAAAFIFLRQRDYFGVAVAACWLSFSLFGVALYMGDARAQELPLLGLSDNPEHDWHYMLSALGLLNADTSLAFLTRVIAFLALAFGVGLGSWLLLNMRRLASSRLRG